MPLPTIGLFGTCGSSRWRDPFIAAYEARGIPYFNPQVAEGAWHPGMVEDENRHLREDEMILFPVTHETPGTGSLGEIGFSALQAIRSNRFRTMVFLIDDECRDPKATPEVVMESNRARRLVKSKIAEEARHWHNIHLVGTMEEMLALTLRLWPLLREMGEIGNSKRA